MSTFGVRSPRGAASPVHAGARTPAAAQAAPLGAVERSPETQRDLIAMEQFRDDWRLHPVAGTVNHHTIEKHVSRGVAKYQVKQLGWEEEKTCYLEFDEDRLQILELEGFFTKTPIIKYVLPYLENLLMVESPNLTDPYIFKVSHDSLRQPLFLTAPQRNEIIVLCCAFTNEAIKRNTAEEQRQRLLSEGGDVHEESENQLNEDDGIKGMHEVLFDYLPEDARLLKVEAGQHITVVGKRDDWLLAIDTKGQMGFVPPTFVRKLVGQ